MGFLNKQKLNERQISILKNANLPTEWKDLNSAGRIGITAIEEMLQYLDKKYGKTFCYNGYVPENKVFLDNGCLYAYAEGDDPDIDTFTVERDGKGFKDGYQWVLKAPGVQQEMEERLEPLLQGQAHEMFTELLGVDADGNVKAFSVNIYIENTDKAYIEKTMDSIIDEIYEDARVYDVNFYCFDKPVTRDMNAKNIRDCYKYEDIVLRYASCTADRKNETCRWVCL